ncbi:hypothetical protein ACYATP_07465 [Lactobacillaceae bacterium Melli_B4]
MNKIKKLIGIVATTTVIASAGIIALNLSEANSTVNAANHNKKHLKKDKIKHKKINKSKNQKNTAKYGNTLDMVIDNYNNAIYFNSFQKTFSSIDPTIANSDSNFLVKAPKLITDGKYEHSYKGLSESALGVASYMNTFDSYVQNNNDNDPEGESNLVVIMASDPSLNIQSSVINKIANKINPADLQKLNALAKTVQDRDPGYPRNYTPLWNNCKQYYIQLAKIFRSLS